MNLLKGSMLFGLAAVLAAGLFFVLQSNADKDTTRNALPPNTCTPEDLGSGPPSIVPDDKDTMRIQYRNILFSRDKRAKAFGSAETSSVASPEFLYIQSRRNPQSAGPLAFPPTLPAGPWPAYGVHGLYSPLREAGMRHQRLEII
jgi:hypothetical protein